MTHATTADIAATDAATAAAFDMLNAARRIETKYMETAYDGPVQKDAYDRACRVTDQAKRAYEAMREAAAAIRAL